MTSPWGKKLSSLYTVGRKLGDGGMYIVDLEDMCPAGVLVQAYKQDSSDRYTLSVSEGEVRRDRGVLFVHGCRSKLGSTPYVIFLKPLILVHYCRYTVDYSSIRLNTIVLNIYDYVYPFRLLVILESNEIKVNASHFIAQFLIKCTKLISLWATYMVQSSEQAIQKQMIQEYIVQQVRECFFKGILRVYRLLFTIYRTPPYNSRSQSI